MEVKFHGDKSKVVDLEVGDLLRFVDVTGKIRQGILVELERRGISPRAMTIVYLHLLEGDALNKVNANLIFKCRKVNTDVDEPVQT